MSKSLLFALALLFATALSAFAEETSTEEAPKKFGLTVGGMYAFRVNGTSLRAAHGPGLFISLDYHLNTRSSLVLTYARQKFVYNEFATETDHMASLAYKYWLTEGGRFRPWVQLGGGYVLYKAKDEFQVGRTASGTPVYETDESSRGNFQLSFGGGVRYELSKRVGLDASAVFYKEGAPWNWRSESQLLTTSLGVDLQF